jgi:transposase
MTPGQSREEQALGVSRGGLTTKIHLLVEGNGLPLSITVTPGQTHESTQVDPLLEGVSVGGKQGPRRKTVRVIAGDKGYDGAPARAAIRRSGARAMVAHKRRADGSYPASAKDFDKELYRRRNIVERRIGHIKEHRRIATRYEKLAVNFVAMIQLAFVLTFINTLLSDTA